MGGGASLSTDQVKYGGERPERLCLLAVPYAVARTVTRSSQREFPDISVNSQARCFIALFRRTRWIAAHYCSTFTLACLFLAYFMAPAQPTIQAQWPEMYPRRPGVPFSVDSWNAIAHDVTFKLGNGFETIHPCSIRPVQKRQ